MLSDELAISVRGLGKRYIIDHQEQPTSLAEAALGFVRQPFKPANREMIWSLDDVSFDVKKGEILGLVGRNGAGKSTLLKVLSRISEPTRGEAMLRGRLGSLIEVGTGFQPELTGRENVYLNGAILGMTRREIKLRFDEIVAFSGVEKYLDTPVKRYSSGMYVRLAFAVAAHLDTEILLIDEVLAVGDADFQAKSVRKMAEVARSGKTILVVSHNAATVEALCTRALLLRSGQLVMDGAVGEVIQEYNKASSPADTVEGGDSRVYLGDRGSHIKSADILDANMAPNRVFKTGDDIAIDLEIEAHDGVQNPIVTVIIENTFGQRIVVARSPCNQRALPDLKGSRRVVCTLSQLAIAPGEYSVNLELGSDGMSLETVEGKLQFTVTTGDPYEDGWSASTAGLVIVRSDWEVD
jgi:lipopolysaccharide transport system ATP-binding protein